MITEVFDGGHPNGRMFRAGNVKGYMIYTDNATGKKGIIYSNGSGKPCTPQIPIDKCTFKNGQVTVAPFVLPNGKILTITNGVEKEI